MDDLKTLKSMLEQQVDQITAKGDINPQDLEMLDKAVDIIKDIETICAMRKAEEQEMNSGYSQRAPYMARYGMDDGGMSYGWYDSPRRNYYTNGGTYTDGMSFRQNRDSMGRYSSRRGYSRDEAKDRMMNTLEDMLNEAATEKERAAIMACMEKIEG